MRVLLLAATVFSVAVSQMAGAQPAPQNNSCFFVTQFEDWKAPDTRTIVIRTTFKRYYRLGLSHECPRLKSPDVHLVINVHGPNTICSPLDWDLKVSSLPLGFASPCIVQSMTPMSPQEVEALPARYRP
ncbi:MAG TPA: DUF6491 family protein [Rhizomicrobium sp.]|nr:DUF6491 family protein [Rhizomicrobium sp.]